MWNSEGNLLESVLSFHKEIQELNPGYNTYTAIFLLAKSLAPFLPFKENLSINHQAHDLQNESSKWECLTLPCHAWGLGKIPPIRSSIFSPFHLLIQSSVNKAGRLLVIHSYCKTHDTIPERAKARIWIRKRKVHCKSIMKFMGQGKKNKWALMLYSMPSFQPEGAMNISFLSLSLPFTVGENIWFLTTLC